ncbi:MAG: hypothetical protein HYW27_01600 [Candidatus Aenigmarchaeota archaeon]|nr:hypothetical protein [Candidatus Aenigmarchaeota archaeon]
MPYSERYLRPTAKRVRNYLADELFGIEGQSRWRILDLRWKDSQRLYRRIGRHRGDTARARRDIARMDADSMYCSYTGDMDLDTDYIVFVNDATEATAVRLGEEMTHGEHMTTHIRNLGAVSRYTERFSGTTTEFMGFLGLRSVERENNGITFDYFDYTGPDVLNPILDLTRDAEHYVGYSVSDQLINSRRRINYRDLFHADSQAVVWDIVKSLIRPRIRVFIEPEKYCQLVVDAYNSLYEGVLERAELDAGIEISKKKRKKQ